MLTIASAVGFPMACAGGSSADVAPPSPLSVVLRLAPGREVVAPKEPEYLADYVMQGVKGKADLLEGDEDEGRRERGQAICTGTRSLSRPAATTRSSA